jgi:hypothetical protein
MTKSVGVVLATPGRASRVVVWNAPGWVVEKAGVVVAEVLVDDALESLASKTVAVRVSVGIEGVEKKEEDESRCCE